jgi:hypothetical protein
MSTVTKFFITTILTISVIFGDTHNEINFGIIIDHNVNVRHAPSLSSEITSKLTKYNLVNVISNEDEWILIEYCATQYEPDNVTTGYVHRDLLHVFNSPEDIVPFFAMRWRETHYDMFPLFFVYAPKMIPINLTRYPYRTMEHGTTIDTLELMYGNKIIGDFPVDIHVDKIGYNYSCSWRVDLDNLNLYAPTDTLPNIFCCPKGRSRLPRNTECIVINLHKLKERLISEATAIFRKKNVEDSLLQEIKLLNYSLGVYNSDTVVDIMGSAFISKDFDHMYYLNLLLISDNGVYNTSYHSYLATTSYLSSWHLEFHGVYDFFEDEVPELIAFWFGCDAFGYVVLELYHGEWKMVFIKYEIV